MSLSVTGVAMKKRKLKVGAEKIKKENKTKPVMIYSNVLWAGSVWIISNVMIGHGFATFSFIFEIKTWFLCNNPELSWSGPRFLEDHRTIPNNYCYYDCRMQSFGTGSVPHCIQGFPSRLPEHDILQWNLDITNLYITKSSV